MLGIETLVMVMSRTTKKFDSARNPPPSHRGAPLMGAKSPAVCFAGSAMMGPSVRGHVDVDVHRQADAQRMGRELLRIERDSHGQALHDLDPVAGGVLRRNERKRGTRTAP